MVQLQNSISEHLHHHTFFSMLSNEIYKAHRAQILSCSSLGANIWFTTQPIFLAFQLSSLVFSTSLHMQLGLPHPSIVGILWCVYTHPINPMGIHLICCAHGNERTGTHDAIHDTFVATRCWLPCGTKTITCTSFNHIQLFLSMNWHCAYQRWHSHLSSRCHCQLNTSKFISPILCNSKICCLWCNSSQEKELSKLTPH